MTASVKAAGSWHVGQASDKIGGSWTPAAIWRKVGGHWKTDASLSAVDTPTALTVTGALASPVTGPATSTATGGAQPYDYAWTKVSGGNIVANTPGAASTTFGPGTPLVVGETRSAVFHCTVTDTLGATVVAGNVTVTLTRYAQPSATVDHPTLSASDATAAKSTAAATVSVTGGTPPFSYAWTKVSGGAITITSPGAASTTFSASGLASGETRSATFRCTVTDAHGLKDTVDVSVAIGRVAALTATRSPATASGSGTTSTISTGSVTATASGGQGPYGFAWTKVSGGAITAVSAGSSATTFRATGLGTGESRTATFKCTVTDTNGATTDTANVTVTITNTASTGATYTPAAGSYNASDVGSVSYTVSASASVPWAWSASSTTGLSASVGKRRQWHEHHLYTQRGAPCRSRHHHHAHVRR
jgi:hypothetical protein